MLELDGRSSHDELSTTLPDDVIRVPVANVNAYMIGRGDGDWVLVDAGMPLLGGPMIRSAAAATFGERPPRAIILTHGHLDHAGGLSQLLRHWDVPVYAHAHELPFLDGRSEYVPIDPTVGGAGAEFARLYHHRGYNFGGRVQPLPVDSSVPELPDWQWLHTPGHTPGHISLFRQQDYSLVAGDAIITVDQENPLDFFLARRTTLHVPPIYFTPDWPTALESIRRLAQLRPTSLATGHGRGISGRHVVYMLEDFAEQASAPPHGRYVGQTPIFNPATGYIRVPPKPADPVGQALIVTVGALVLAALMWRLRDHEDER